MLLNYCMLINLFSLNYYAQNDGYVHMYLYTLLGPEGEEEEAAVDWSSASLSGQDSVRLVSFLKTASQVNCT